MVHTVPRLALLAALAALVSLVLGGQLVSQAG